MRLLLRTQGITKNTTGLSVGESATTVSIDGIRMRYLKLNWRYKVKLNNNEIFALSDYLRHQLAIEYPMEQYFIDKAATALEDLANERAELKAEIALLNTPVTAWSRTLNGKVIDISYKPSETDSNN